MQQTLKFLPLLLVACGPAFTTQALFVDSSEGGPLTDSHAPDAGSETSSPDAAGRAETGTDAETDAGTDAGSAETSTGVDAETDVDAGGAETSVPQCCTLGGECDGGGPIPCGTGDTVCAESTCDFAPPPGTVLCTGVVAPCH